MDHNDTDRQQLVVVGCWLILHNTKKAFIMEGIFGVSETAVISINSPGADLPGKLHIKCEICDVIDG